MDTSSSTSNVPLLAVPGPFMGFTNEVVTVLVGPEETPFHIHKGLLCSKSVFFRAAFQGSFKEATEKKIRLKDEKPEVFQYYATWIYTQSSVPDWTYLHINANLCCRLYVLSDKLGSEEFQNIIIDMIHKLFIKDYSLCLDPETVNYVYDNTLPGSRLRTVLIHELAWNVDIETHPELVNAVPEFLFEILKICSKRLPRRLEHEKGPLDTDWCKTYHVHSDGRICSTTPPSPGTEWETSDSESESD
ncbi:MAG: hypothetical protein Q9226_005132 [Calogaya cf. arnoldii]